MELAECLDELFLVPRHTEIDLHVFARLEGLLRHLCMETGTPEVYDRFKHHQMMLTDAREKPEQDHPRDK